MQLKQKNSQSLNELYQVIDDINNLDMAFNAVHGDSETLMKEAKENYYSILNNIEVPT